MSVAFIFSFEMVEGRVLIPAKWIRAYIFSSGEPVK